MGAYFSAAFILFLGITFFVEVPGFRRRAYVKVGRKTVGICFVVSALIMATVPYAQQHNLLPDDAFLRAYAALFALPVGVIIVLGVLNVRARREGGGEEV